MPYQTVAIIAAYISSKYVFPRISRAMDDACDEATAKRRRKESERAQEGERQDAARRRDAEFKSCQTTAPTGGASAYVGRDEAAMDRKHGLLHEGMTPSGVRERMGEPDHVEALGSRELWNYGLGHSPARWQALFDNGRLIGAYTRGSYRFQRSEAGTTSGAG